MCMDSLNFTVIQLDLKYELDMPPLFLGLSLEVLACMDGLNFTAIQLDLKYKMDKSPLSQPTPT